MKIRVENLRRVFSDATRELVVLDSVDFEFPEQSSIAIVGRSGVGKSTFLHLIAGLEKPTAGRIFFDQTSLTDFNNDELARFRGRNIGFIFQFHHLLHEFSSAENVALPLVIQGADDAECRARAEELLAAVGLADRRLHRPGQLSGGEQQRVAIARALACKPAVLLGDEPTGNLDFRTAKEVQELIVSLCRAMGTTLMIVTHDQNLAQSMDHVYEMLPGGALSVKK